MLHHEVVLSFVKPHTVIRSKTELALTEGGLYTALCLWPEIVNSLAEERNRRHLRHATFLTSLSLVKMSLFVSVVFSLDL